MAAPPTISADGYYVATRAGAVVGEATLRMKTAAQGTLAFGGLDWKITGDPSKKKLRGYRGGLGRRSEDCESPRPQRHRRRRDS